MTAYVDRLVGWGQKAQAQVEGQQSLAERYFGNGKQSCHLTADTRQELDEFAQKIGLKRAWIQFDRGDLVPHYDLTPNKRAQALRAGAVDVTGREHEHYPALAAKYKARLTEVRG